MTLLGFVGICVGLVVVVFALAFASIHWRKRKERHEDASTYDTTASTSTPRRGAKTERVKTDKRRLAYRYDDGAIFVHGNTVWTGVRLTDVSDIYMSPEKIEETALRATQGLTNLAKDDDSVPVQYRITHQPAQFSDWSEQILEHAWNPTRMYEDYIWSQMNRLRANKTTETVGYLLVQIDTLTPGMVDRLQHAAASTVMGVDDEVIPAKLAAEWEIAARRVMANLHSIAAAPITRRDRMWLIRKPLSGHLMPAMDDYPDTKPWGVGEFELWVDLNATNHRRHIRIDATNAEVEDPDRNEQATTVESYTAFVAIADASEEIESGHGGAWLRDFAEQGLEVSYRMNILSAKTFTKSLDQIANNLRDEIDNLNKTGQPIPALLEADSQMATAAVERAKSHDGRAQPGIEAQVLIQVSAASEDELNEDVERLVRYAKNDLGMTLVRPSRWQYRMLELMLPGGATPPRIGGVPFLRITEPGHFGIGLPQVGTELGDYVEENGNGWIGNYLGMGNGAGLNTGTGVPVFHSPHSATAKNTGGGVFIVGASGGGKTSLALLLFFQASESGVRTIVLDPKVDFAAFCYYLAFGPQVNHPEFPREADEGTVGQPGSRFTPINQQFWDDTLVVNIRRAAPGSLDPWQVEPDADSGLALAKQLLSMFMGREVYARHNDVLASALNEAMRGYRRRRDDLFAQKMAALGGQSSLMQERDAHAAAAAEAPRPTLLEVIKIVEHKYDAAREEHAGLPEYVDKLEALASILSTLRTAPYASLAFAEKPASLDGAGGTTLAAKRRLVFTLAGMELPKSPDAERWTEPQRMASAVMYLLVTLAASLLLTAPKERNPRTGQTGATRPSMLIVDESYMVTSTDGGVNLLKQTLAQGRSLGIVTVLMDQLAGRLAHIETNDSEAEASGNQIEAVFAFLQKSNADGAKVASLLTDSNVDAVGGALRSMDNGGHLRTGRCLYRDSKNRLGRLDVDIVFNELLRAMDTNPVSRPVSQAKPISSDVMDWTYLGEMEREAAIEEATEAIDADTNDEPATVDGVPAGTVGAH